MRTRSKTRQKKKRALREVIELEGEGKAEEIKRKTGEREGERMRDLSYIGCQSFKTELTSVMMDYEWLLFVLNEFCIIRGQMNSLL